MAVLEFCSPLVAAFLPGSSGLAPASALEEFLTVEEALALCFPEADRFEAREVLLSVPLREELARTLRLSLASKPYSFRVACRGSTTLGYAVVGNVKGKSLPITYLVALTPSLAVEGVEILIYRESHGSEVRQKRFRNQFVAKQLSDGLELKRDIKHVAGATISCRSLTHAVHDALATFDAVQRAGLLAGARLATEEPRSAGGADAGGWLSRSQLLMGTTLTIRAAGPSRQTLEAACSLAFAEVSRLEALISAFRPESEISALARAAGGARLVLAPETFELLQAADVFVQRFGGAFDPAARPLSILWRESVARGRAPSEDELSAARALSGWRHVDLDPSTSSARLVLAGASLDLGAIGKGYALDRAAALLARAGVASGLLDFGGQVLALGPPPDAPAWEILLRDPRFPGGEPLTLALERGSLATSADYERGLALEGGALSHVIDPRSGWPASGCLGVTVLADTAMEADALSTALFVLGAEEGSRVAEREGLRAWFFSAVSDTQTRAFAADLAHPAGAGR